MALKFGTSGIRGLNTEFTTEIVKAYIQAFLEHAKTKTDTSTIAVAGDLRESTPGIQFLVESSIKELGSQAVDCGKLPTPALALYCLDKKIPGIMITGSHIPADRNGIKFYWPWGEILKDDELAIMKNFDRISTALVTKPTTSHSNAELAAKLFIDRYTDFFAPYREYFKGKTIAIYQHSAVSRDLWKPILTTLGFEVIEIGRTAIFTPVDTETDEAVQALRTLIDPKLLGGLFAVVSSDGDADRPFLCDEKLQMVRGDTIGILSSGFLKATYVVTPVSTNTALEKSKLVNHIVRTRIGSPFVIEGMDQAPKQESVVGFEANGGLLLGSNVTLNGRTISKLPTRDSVLPVLCCLALAAEKQNSLSELVNTLPARFTDSDLLREFPIEKKAEIYQAALEGETFKKTFISKHGPISERNEVDGLRLTFSNGNIVHLRPSGNAPEFRCYAEASTAIEARQLVQDGIQWLKNFK